MLAWHWIKDDRTLRDGTKMIVGEKLVHAYPHVVDGETFEGPSLCHSGYHASERIIDAMQYAPGSVICRVECGGVIVRGADKIVCTERTVIAAIDATEILRSFARQCALDVAHLWSMPAVVQEFLDTGDETKRDAARAAAWVVARSAARDAALAAARNDARSAAMNAAWSAARATARAAARAAALAAQNERLCTMVMAEIFQVDGKWMVSE